jgi:NAD(P)-dependent dehydrogenase (short-subunit alcohol dehydrogenase family)
MSTALIIGASRGIGFELARQYRSDGWRVIATVRKASDAASLTALGCEVLTLDVDNVEQCAAFGWQINDERLDVAILNAGIYGPNTSGLESPSAADFDAVMHANVLGAMRLLPLVGPLVAQVHGRLAVVSSMMGSIGLRAGTAGWLYRASKAALNSVLVDTALSFGPASAICVAMHPGWVRTAMGGEDADLAVEDSVRGIRTTLANLRPTDNGKFFNYNGAALTW